MTDIGVLIVDDEEDMRFALRMLLDGADGKVRVVGEAETGSETLLRIDELDPAVVVLDERLPDMRGTEVAKRIRERRPHQRMILCSAYLDHDLRKKAADAGIIACLGKEEMHAMPERVRQLMEAPA